MIYIDKEPLHKITIPQMSKVIQRENNRVIVRVGRG